MGRVEIGKEGQPVGSCLLYLLKTPFRRFYSTIRITRVE